MNLNEAQIKLISEKIELLKISGCPFCQKKLQLNSTILELREFNGGGMTVGSSSSIFPVVALTCKECGHVEFFSAVFLGVFDLNPENEQQH